MNELVGMVDWVSKPEDLRRTLIEVCLGSFDEEGCPEDLERAAERFLVGREFWLTGERRPKTAIGRALEAYYGPARSISSSSVLEVERSLAILADFCLQRAAAHRARREGWISVALRYEERADRAYDNLKGDWVW